MDFMKFAPLSKKPFSFTQNGLDCAYDPRKAQDDYGTSITFQGQSGATVCLILKTWPGRSVLASVNGTLLWTGRNSGKIKDPKLRAVVEAGMTAWALEMAAQDARAAQAKIEALKSL
jgi:hypothetical protein